MVSFAALLAACSSTVIASKQGDGAGYARMTPNAGTRTYIFKHDPLFTRQVGAHNEQCLKDPMCRK